MSERQETILEGQIIDERAELSLVQLCQRCRIETELVYRMVEEGILEPSRVDDGTPYFPYHCTIRTQTVVRLRNDLGVNLAGAALALELLDQIALLKSRM